MPQLIRPHSESALHRSSLPITPSKSSGHTHHSSLSITGANESCVCPLAYDPLLSIVVDYSCPPEFQPTCHTSLSYACRAHALAAVSREEIACIRDSSAEVSSHIDVINVRTGQCIRSFRQSGPTLCLLVLPNGLIVTDSWDASIKVWGVVENRCIAQLKGHKGRISSLALLLHGRMASGTEAGHIKIWSLVTQQCEVDLNYGEEVSHLSVLPDGKLLAGNWGAETIKVWDIPKPDVASSPRKSLSSNATSNSPQRSRADSSSTSLSFPITLQPVVSISSKSLSQVMVPLTAEVVARGCEDYTVKLLNLYSRSIVVTLYGHQKRIISLARLSCLRLASGSHDGVIKIWDPFAGECMQTLQTSKPSAIQNLVVLDHNTKLLISTWDAINIWQVESSQEAGARTS